MNSFRVYTVETKYEGYNDWHELEGIFSTFEEAVEFIDENFLYKGRISLWQDSSCVKEWKFEDGAVEDWRIDRV